MSVGSRRVSVVHIVYQISVDGDDFVKIYGLVQTVSSIAFSLFFIPLGFILAHQNNLPGGGIDALHGVRHLDVFAAGLSFIRHEYGEGEAGLVAVLKDICDERQLLVQLFQLERLDIDR